MRIVPAIQAASCAPPSERQILQPLQHRREDAQWKRQDESHHHDGQRTAKRGPFGRHHPPRGEAHDRHERHLPEDEPRRLADEVAADRYSSVSPARPVVNATSRGNSATTPMSLSAR